MIKLTDRNEWKALISHQKSLASTHMRTLFEEDRARLNHFSLTFKELSLDFSKNIINNNALDSFTQLAHALNVPEKIEAFFTGQPINVTENRAALHTALRDKNHTPIWINGENIALKIAAAKEKMRAFVAKVHTKK